MRIGVLLLVALLTCGFISDNAIHLPPDCGTYAYNSYTPATTGFPSVGGTFLDPIFGETFTRLSNIYPATSGSQILYTINGFWNADSTVFLHDSPATGVSIINPATGALIRDNVPYPLTTTDAVSFDPVNADIYYYTNGTSLSKYSVSGNSSSTVKTFGSTLGGLGQSNDWIDKTGDIFLLNLGGVFRIWKKSTDTLYTGSITIPTGGNGIPPGWAGLSPDGNYVITSQTPEKTSYAINHGTSTVATTGVLFWDACTTDHADVMSATDGNTYALVCQNSYTMNGTNRHFFRVLVTNNASGQGSAQLTQPGNQLLFSLPNNLSGVIGNGDFSCAARGTYQDWCYMNIADPTDTLSSLGTWYAYKSELMMVHMLAPFEVRRLMHHRAEPHRGFCRQIRPSVNWEGTKVIFSSPFRATDSADCGYSDIYRYDAP